MTNCGHSRRMFLKLSPKTVLACVSLNLRVTRIRVNGTVCCTCSWTATVTSNHDRRNSHLPFGFGATARTGTPLAPSLGFFRRKSDFFHPVRIFRSRVCLFRHTSTDSTEALVSAIATAYGNNNHRADSDLRTNGQVRLALRVSLKNHTSSTW